MLIIGAGVRRGKNTVYEETNRTLVLNFLIAWSESCLCDNALCSKANWITALSSKVLAGDG